MLVRGGHTGRGNPPPVRATIQTKPKPPKPPWKKNAVLTTKAVKQSINERIRAPPGRKRHISRRQLNNGRKQHAPDDPRHGVAHFQWTGLVFFETEFGDRQLNPLNNSSAPETDDEKASEQWGGGGWHKASALGCLPLAVPIGLWPLLILTLCGSERVLVVSTEGVGGQTPFEAARALVEGQRVCIHAKH